jgi:hypothetical protein
VSATGVGVVVIDTMPVSALVNATRNPQRAAV